MKEFLEKRLFIVFYISAALLILLSFGLGIGSIVTQRKLQNHFVPSDTSSAKSQYRTCSTMEEMDMDAFSPYFIFAMTAEGRPDIELALPCDVHYYRMENGRRRKAFTMRKGTIVIIPNVPDPGRGIHSYPSFKKGLRYEKPFNAADGSEDNAYYYVKLSELEKVSEELFRVSPSLEQTRRMQGISRESAVYEITRLIDKVFYTEGIFLSPDLQKIP